ncbi:MAG: hypothetical protein R2710_12780 [Acidimicrobiales bacterium]
MAPSHALLVRGGFIRQLHAGHYSMLPMDRRVHQKVANIVGEEINAIGGRSSCPPCTRHRSGSSRAAGTPWARSCSG